MLWVRCRVLSAAVTATRTARRRSAVGTTAPRPPAAWLHVSQWPQYAKKKGKSAERVLGAFGVTADEEEEARARQEAREAKEEKATSFNVAVESSARRAEVLGPQPEGREKWNNFTRFLVVPIFIGLCVLYAIHEYIVDSAFGGDDTEMYDYMIGECFELAAANAQVMQKLGGQMSTDDSRVQFIPKDQGMRTIIVLPLYGMPGKMARCEVDCRTLTSGEVGIYSARVIFPGGEVIRLETPTKRYGGRFWLDNLTRDQEERQEQERKQQQQQRLQALQQGMRPS